MNQDPRSWRIMKGGGIPGSEILGRQEKRNSNNSSGNGNCQCPLSNVHESSNTILSSIWNSLPLSYIYVSFVGWH